MACGCEKKDDGKKCNDFTKAVINIENPETLTLFHKVVIPASMGDETAVPPAVGKYCNTLVYYEASEHSYLYSSDGIPTFITGKDGKDGANGKDGADGKDGVIQYTAGTGISISAQNVISATGSAAVAWGDVTGDLENQTDLNNALGAKQDTLTAGANITIDGDNEISATDTTYTAGTNVSISSSNVISATDTTYTDFVGASSLLDGASGLVPKPLKSQRGKFLKGDGSWGTPTNTTYTAGNGLSLNGTEFSVDTTTIQPKLTAGANVNIDANNEISATDTTYNDFVGTDGVSAGTHGLVPAPATTDANAFLKGDGTWGNPPGTTYTAGTNIQINGSTISATDTTYSNFGGATTLVAGSAGLVPAPTTSDPDKFLKGDGTWGTPTNTTYSAGTNITIDANNEISATDTTYSNFTGTDGVSAGTAGLVPGPTTSDTDKYLKSDGTWATVSGGGGSNITMTSSDPGEGQPLAADQYLAYYTAGAAREVQTSSGNSITLDAGKWIIMHTAYYHQNNAPTAMIMYTTLGNADPSTTTVALPATSGQNYYSTLTRFNVVEFSSQTTCTPVFNPPAGQSANFTVDKQRWLAIPID